MKAVGGCLLYWVMIGLGIVAVALVAAGLRDSSPAETLTGIGFAVATWGVYRAIDRHKMVDW